MTATRREVLQGGAALVIALQLPGCALMRGAGAIEQAFDATGQFRPNAWLRIGADDRIVFVLDRVEMGQGTMTSHATMVAEELEVDPLRVEVELAPADRAYDNPSDATPFQITGGSTSVRMSWEPLRRAGATAREMLRRGAAATWKVPLDECRAEDGAIVHPPSGRRARYGELVEAAARQGVPSVKLKPPGEWKYLGTSVPRLDGRMKVDGTAIYGIDVTLPDLVTAVVVRPPVFGARLRRFDASAAKARGGVLDVFAIDEGVAVVADTYWKARRAADVLTVEWDEGAMATASTEAMRREFAVLAARPGKVARDDGNAGRALRRAARTLEAVYELPYLPHATMEPQNCTAHVANGRCEIWAPTQAPGVARLLAADRLGYELRDVTVHQTLLGGGFGRRLAQDFVVEAVQIALAVRRPVKVVWSREDDMAHDHYRPMTYNLIRGGLDKDGAIVAWLHRLVCQSNLGAARGYAGRDFTGALLPDGTPRALRRWVQNTAPGIFARNTMIDETSTEGAVDLPYAIRNVRVEHTAADTGVPIGFWRSVGHSHTSFVVESFLDELAAAAGRDPVAVRRDLLAKQPGHLRVLELAAEKAGWGSAMPTGHGRGIAVHHSFASTCAHVVEVESDGKDVRVRRVVSAIDCGRAINPDLVRAQVESAIVFGLSAALKQQITIEGGRVLQSNFHDLRTLRMHECPTIEVHLVESSGSPTGVGEPGVPPVAPALGNAVFAATGTRVRRLPLEAALREGA